jgi:hypothetical protein
VFRPAWPVVDAALLVELLAVVEVVAGIVMAIS